MEESEVKKSSPNNFGLMFQLGAEGVHIIPLDFEDGVYQRATRKICRVSQRTYSHKIDLVNYVVQDSTIYTDPLAGADIKDYGAMASDELFFNVIEDDELLNKIVVKLHGEYKTTVH